MTNVNQVAAIARDVPKKTSKKKAFEAVEDMVNQLEASGGMTDEMQWDLSRLWAHFMPGKIARPRTAFDWVAKAQAKNDVRYYLRYIKVDEDSIVATDGHRLHIAPNDEGLSPGFYGHEKAMLEEAESMQFPNIERAIPDPDAEGRVWLEVKTDELEIETKATVISGKDVVLNAYQIREGQYVNADYLNAAASMEDGPLSINVGDVNASVLLAGNDGRRAVVMPLRW